MNNIRLFFKESLSNNLTGKLNKDQSHYLLKVMRIKIGDHFNLFNENDKEFFSKILKIKSLNSSALELHENFLANKLPIVDFPEPIIPNNTIFFLISIFFFIEKTQICLNLKLSKIHAIL